MQHNCYCPRYLPRCLLLNARDRLRACTILPDMLLCSYTTQDMLPNQLFDKQPHTPELYYETLKYSVVHSVFCISPLTDEDQVQTSQQYCNSDKSTSSQLQACRDLRHVIRRSTGTSYFVQQTTCVYSVCRLFLFLFLSRSLITPYPQVAKLVCFMFVRGKPCPERQPCPFGLRRSILNCTPRSIFCFDSLFYRYLFMLSVSCLSLITDVNIP